MSAAKAGYQNLISRFSDYETNIRKKKSPNYMTETLEKLKKDIEDFLKNNKDLLKLPDNVKDRQKLEDMKDKIDDYRDEAKKFILPADKTKFMDDMNKAKSGFDDYKARKSSYSNHSSMTRCRAISMPAEGSSPAGSPE